MYKQASKLRKIICGQQEHSKIKLLSSYRSLAAGEASLNSSLPAGAGGAGGSAAQRYTLTE